MLFVDSSFVLPISPPQVRTASAEATRKDAKEGVAESREAEGAKIGGRCAEAAQGGKMFSCMTKEASEADIRAVLLAKEKIEDGLGAVHEPLPVSKLRSQSGSTQIPRGIERRVVKPSASCSRVHYHQFTKHKAGPWQRVILALSFRESKLCQLKYEGLYVAMSRVTSKEDMRLLVHDKDWSTCHYISQLRPHPSAKAFIAGFQNSGGTSWDVEEAYKCWAESKQ